MRRHGFRARRIRPHPQALILVAALAAAASGEENPDWNRTIRRSRSAAAETPAASGEWDWGFLASRLRETDGRMRLRVLGPLYEQSWSPGGESLLAVRPFYAVERIPDADRVYRDYLWPAGRSSRLGNDLSWRILLAYGHNFDVTDPGGRYRLWVLPVFFQGRDAKGESYTAVFPIGGRVSEIFGQDRVEFALFPLWARTELGEVRSHHVLWPVYAQTHGKGIYRFRIFPFFGRNVHRDQFEKRFILWPIWTDVTYRYPHSRGYGYMLFPLWGRAKLTGESTWMFLPPLIRHTRSQQMDAFHVWPFIQRRTGREERLAVWPLYGRRLRPGIETRYVLWPIGWRERIDRGDAVLRRRAVLPFYQDQSLRVRGDPGPARDRHVRLWPLASYDRADEDVRFRVLELWPMRPTRPVERSWADWWTLFEYRAQGDARRTELLWGLFRRQARGEAWRRTSLFPLVEWESEDRGTERFRSWSVLKGLLAREDSPAGTRYRILYLLRLRAGRAEPQEP